MNYVKNSRPLKLIDSNKKSTPMGGQYRGTFFSTGTERTFEKNTVYRSAGTFISQFLGGTLIMKKSLSVKIGFREIGLVSLVKNVSFRDTHLGTT